MISLAPVIKGSVKIEVLRDGLVVKSQETPNTLVIEAPKIMLGNIIGPGLTGAQEASFGDTTGEDRPVVSAGGLEGPSTKLAVTYLGLGYVEGTDQTDNIVVGPTDKLPLQANLSTTKKITSVELGEYSVRFICSFVVTEETATRNYFEAALLCPVLADNRTSNPPDPSDDSFSILDQVMFAHQVHNPIQANVDSTIQYTWTITMQDPSNT